MLETLYRLGIATSYSRPRTRNDHPYAEAFRTCKDCPAWPAHGFADLDAARTWRQPWDEHRHGGRRCVTPPQRHQGQDPTRLAQRQAVYEQARAGPPERCSGAARNREPIAEVWLNPSAEVSDGPVSKSQTKYIKATTTAR